METNRRSGPARVVIADDHPLFRDALRNLLSGQPDLELVGEAADGREALELCRRLRPELVLMDLRMPGMDGLSATREIKRAFPRTVVLMLTASEDHAHLSEALKVGAAGYVLKNASRERMIEAIRRVLRGEFPLNQELAMRLILRLMDEGPKVDALNPASPEETPLKREGSPRIADAAGDRGPAADNTGAVQSGDSAQLADQREHRQEARGAHHRQAGGLRPHPGGHPGHRARPASRAGRITTIPLSSLCPWQGWGR